MSLEQVLAEQLEALNEMAEILAQELEAIVARDHEALISVVEQKVIYLDKIQQRDQFIASLLRQENTDFSDELVNTINQRLADCKKQNEVNQVAATQSQIASQKLREILFGKSQTGYDKTGKATSLPNPIARGLKA